MSTPRRLLPPLLAPALGAAFIAFWVTAEAGRLGTSRDAIDLFGALIPYGLAIALSRARPAAGLALVLAVPVVQLIVVLLRPGSTTWPILEGALVLAFASARFGSDRVRWAGLVAGLVWASAVGFSLVFSGGWLSWIGIGENNDFPQLALQWALTLGGVHALLWACCWTAGLALHLAARRGAAVEQLDRTERELLIAGYELQGMRERSHIAQEVHDVLAHSLAVVIALADGSRFLRATRPESTEAALQRIAETGRAALSDLRGLIEGLTDDTDRPQPGLVDLPELIDRIEGTGAAVVLRELGAPAGLSPAQELCVYRIVQESLTNVLKHGGADPRAAVSLTWDGPGLLLTVVSRAGEGAAAVPERRGFGLAGMEHRARLAGGWLTAGLDPDGSFVVTAFLPTAAAAAATEPRQSAEEAA
ncbi:Signal transduction histidine kinase [Rathayibacter oskolensis]|uniref:histidine kinase n=1 Tax=Rathayibacter oskolensis TaxID=1891671 RepID=A0A1X7MXK4_9MICO|nr:histidine kinase [Rathayibacter oskolensis]SMH29612.1 Signal transduction histidine kinase [Rathayibacter oskolensis]